MLSERQKRILWAVTESYIASAEPVGSRTISKVEDVGFSAATIRNEMSDLEEMGYLEQLHSSSGRIPSQLGYRFYVDHLLKPSLLSKQDVFLLQQYYFTKLDCVEQMIEQTSSIISQLTQYMTIILGPKLADNKVKLMQLVPISDNIAISILVTDKGQVHQQRVTVPENTPLSSIENLICFLNERLAGVALSKLKLMAKKELSIELQKHFEQYEQLVTLLDQMLDMEEEEVVYRSGTTQMLNQPEFRDTEKLKSLLEIVEQQQMMVRLFAPNTNGIQVKIGHEHHIEEVKDCSVITTSYTIQGIPVGSIGILGPTRMDYRKVIGLLEYVSSDLSDRINQTLGLKHDKL